MGYRIAFGRFQVAKKVEGEPPTFYGWLNFCGSVSA